MYKSAYSLTSSYRHLYNMDTSVKRTHGSVPLVSVLKKFDCILQNTSCIRKMQVISGGGGVGSRHPLHPSPRSAPFNGEFTNLICWYSV